MPQSGRRPQHQKRQAVTWTLSALPPKADKQQVVTFVRFVPKADSCTAANDQLSNRLVGYRQHFRRHFDAELSSRLQVDGRLEIGRLRDRKLGWLLASMMRLA